jgi:hypothetical protein
MKDSFGRLGGMSAVAVGVLSIVYAVFYLVIAGSPDRRDCTPVGLCSR